MEFSVDGSLPTTVPTTPLVMNPFSQLKTRIERFFAPPAPMTSEPSKADLANSVLNLLDAGAGEEELVNALKALCAKAENVPMGPSVSIRHARELLANRLHKESLDRFAEYEANTQIVRSGFQAQHKYKPVFEMVDTNYTCVEKYDSTPPEKDERYRLVQQELAVKTMLVLTELVLDYNKLCANAQQGTNYTRDSLSVLTKPDEVDAIFADADAAFARSAADKQRQQELDELLQPIIQQPALRENRLELKSRTPLATKARITDKALQVLKDNEFQEVPFSDVVIGHYCPGIGASFYFRNTPVGGVNVNWKLDGEASVTRGDIFTGYTAVDNEALALLKAAGVLERE